MSSLEQVAGGFGLRWRPLISGALLLVLFVWMAHGFGFGSQAGVMLHWVAARESLFWLTHALIAVPGVLLVAYGLEPAAMPVLGRVAAELAELSPKAQKLLAASYFVVLFALARSLRSAVLLDLPVTDDENMLDFGARVMAAGKLCVPEPPLRSAFRLLYMHSRDGCLTSFDFPGNLAFRALGVATGLGSVLYAACAALGGLGVAITSRRLWGERSGWLAGLVWLFSPMALWLSATTHPQLVSRTLVALVYALWAGLMTCSPERWRVRTALVLGLLAGLAGACRPVEALALLLPVAVHLGLLAVRGRRWSFLGAALLAAAVPVTLFLAYNSAITGSWALLPRLAPGADAFRVAQLTFAPWSRLGVNTGTNLMLLGIWLLGPLGLLAVLLGASTRQAAPRVLAGGVVLLLGSTMLHGNTGIHTVGPIHFSEAAVPLLLLAVAGLRRSLDFLPRLGVPRSRATWLLLAYLGVALPVFHLVHGVSMYEQADNQSIPLETIRAANIHHAIVLAPLPGEFWKGQPARARSGSWVLVFPPPDPFSSDEVLVVRERTDPTALRQAYPGRSLWRLAFPPGWAPLLLPLPLDEHHADGPHHE